MPQTIFVLPRSLAGAIPGMLVNAGVVVVRDRELAKGRSLTCELGRGRVTVTFMDTPEWAGRLDEALVKEETVLVGVQRGSFRFLRRADDVVLYDRIASLFEPHALIEPHKLG
jgi:hypothetical protein